MPREILMPVTAIPAAGTSTTTPLTGLGDVGDILLQAAFDYGSGGTTVDAYVQTSLDGGTSWIDIANFRFTTSDLTKVASVGAGGDLSALATPTDGTLTANTTVDGILGDQYRVKLVVVGTYVASTLSIFMQTRTDLGAPSTVGIGAAALTALENIGLNAGETHIGEVGGNTSLIKPTIVVDTGIYAALDILGALVVSGVVTLTNAMRISGGTGVLQSVTVFDDDNEKAVITLLFFDSAPASGTYIGNAALAFSAGDKAKYIGKVNILASDYETVGGEALACIRGIGLPVKAVGSANLFMIPIVSSGTPTFTAATDIQMALTFLCD